MVSGQWLVLATPISTTLATLIYWLLFTRFMRHSGTVINTIAVLLVGVPSTLTQTEMAWKNTCLLVVVKSERLMRHHAPNVPPLPPARNHVGSTGADNATLLP